MKPFVILYGKLWERSSRVNTAAAFVEQRRNIVDFLSAVLLIGLPSRVVTCQIRSTKTDHGESSRNDCCKHPLIIIKVMIKICTKTVACAIMFADNELSPMASLISQF